MYNKNNINKYKISIKFGNNKMNPNKCLFIYIFNFFSKSIPIFAISQRIFFWPVIVTVPSLSGGVTSYYRPFTDLLNEKRLVVTLA